MVYKTSIFWRLKNNYEDLIELLKILNQTYCLNYKQEKPNKDKTRKKF